MTIPNHSSNKHSILDNSNIQNIARRIAEQQPGERGSIVWIDADGNPSIISVDVLKQRLNDNPKAGILGMIGAPGPVAEAVEYLDRFREAAKSKKYTADLMDRLRGAR
jgi:hypothetical protein